MSKTDPNNSSRRTSPAARAEPTRTERAAGGETPARVPARAAHDPAQAMPEGIAEGIAEGMPVGMPEKANGAGPGRPDAAHLRTIDRNRLESQLGESARAWPIEIVAQTTSTNADLLQALRAERAARGQREPGQAHGLAQPRVKVAYEQTAGRGRRGRSWVAQPGDALLFSVGGRIPRGVDGLTGLSLAVGLAVYEALCDLPIDGSQLALKWPNDVLVGGAKVSGILIETAGGDAQTTAVVVGIGINLHGAATLAARLNTGDAKETGSEQSISQRSTSPRPASAQLASAQPASAQPASLQPASAQHASAQPASLPPLSQAPGFPATAPPTPPTALDAIWDTPSMTDLLATLLNTLARTFERFGAQGFAPFRQAWCEADAYRGQAVVLYEGGTTAAHGIGRGVDAQGQLLLETPQGLRAIASGDVSLRPA